MSYINEQNKAQLYQTEMNGYKIILFVYTSESNYFVWKYETLHVKRPDVTSGLRPWI